MILQYPTRSASVCLLCLVSAISFGAETATAQDVLRDQVSSHVQPYLDQKIISGLSVGVLSGGQSWTSGYGRWTDKLESVPNDRTVYEIGSISKVFTGLLLADAIERGPLRLDQRFTELVPSTVASPHDSQVDITLVHLATHTSGLPRMPSNMADSDPKNPYLAYSPQKLYEFLSQHRLRRMAGEKHEYSNLAMGLLGQLLADQAEVSYQELLLQRITQPLALQDTVQDLSADQRARLAEGHDASGQSVGNWDFDALAGAGAVRSTVHDLLLFAKAILQPPDNELGRAIELAWKIHQPPPSETDFAMGLGWLVARDGSTRFHNGQTGGYHSALFVSRELKQAVVVLANTATMEVDRLAEDVFKVVAGMNVAPREFPVEVSVPVETLQRYAGTYQLGPGMIFTVSVNNGRLMVGLTGQSTFQVFSKSETEWYYKIVPASITFNVDDQGQVDSLELFQNGARMKAPKIQ
ncbi:MAG: serine hydrolase [Pirellulaceae bacterium]|nr:serine hydrolase [Pirellulaceae bacterium]